MKNETIQVGGKTYMKARVVMLPTEKATGLFKHTCNWRGEKIYGASLVFSDNETYIRNTHLINSGKAATNSEDKYDFFNLYILSSEEIKEGDWFKYHGHICKCIKADKSGLHSDEGIAHRVNAYKIIATTDELPTTAIPNPFGREHYLPRPSSEFLQAYCKANGKIEEVLVELEESRVGGIGIDSRYEYKLKVASDNTITIKKVEEKSIKEDEMFQNMQYYMEHCQAKGYCTPQDWIDNHKHF